MNQAQRLQGIGKDTIADGGSPCVFGMQSGYYDSGERATFKTSSTYSAQIARPSSHRSIEWGTASHRQTETTQVT